MIELSPFPTGFLGTELYYSGAWHDVMDEVDQGGASSSHGVRSEGGTADVASMAFTLANPTGKYSARNPSSELFGLIGRNTPARSYVDLGAPWLDLTASGSAATCPDTAALSITGDIDLRVEFSRDDWSADDFLLLAKYGAAGDRSYALYLIGGLIWIYWTADGTNWLGRASTVVVPAWAGRIALRATLDVDNGAGGHTATFYTAARLDGTWVQLGEPVVTAGTTSIFDSTHTVQVGSGSGKVYGWEIRDGIAGAVVSGVDTSTLTVGAGTFSDGTNTYTLYGSAAITNRHYLGVCEISEWPLTWGRKGSPSVLTEVEASGPMRRLGQGASPLSSALRRGILGLTTPARAYWPCEDGATATALAAGSLGTRPMAVSGTPTMAAYDGFACSESIPTIGDSRWTGAVPAYTHAGEAAVRFLVNFPATGMANGDIVASVYTTGTLARVDLQWTTSGGLRLLGYDSDGGLTETGGTVAFGAQDVAWRVSIELAQDGADVEWGLWALSPAGAEGGVNDTFTTQTIGRVTRVIINPNQTCATDMAVGHVSVQSEILLDTWALLYREVGAWIGEQADARVARLTAENGVTCTIRGAHGDSVALGVQGVRTLLDLLGEAALAAGGILHDDPAALALRYRTMRSMCDQPAVEIDYTDNLVIPFEPVDDDARLRNRVTVTRDGGSSSVEELETGTLSTADVGVYDESVTLSLGSDEQTSLVAQWRVHLGTWDEARYPSLGVDLAHPTFLADAELTRDLLALAIGDRLVVNDPPAWLPPDAVDVLVVGRTLDITPMHARLRWTCIPARPFRVAHWTTEHRWSGEGTVTAEALDATETEVDVTPPTDVVWTHDDGDYDVMIGGERMTVTGVAGNTLTVTRSVNGIVKSHAIGAAVRLAEPSFWGL